MKNSWFTVQKVHQNIYALAEFHHWEKVVSYQIIDQTQAFLIDTGMGYESIKLEIAKLTSLPVKVLLTHAHWDHIGGTNEFEDISVFNDPFEIKSLEAGFISGDIDELMDSQMFSQTKYSVKKYRVLGIKNYTLLSDGQI